MLALLLALPATAVEPIDFRDAAEEERYYDLIKEIRCLVCQNQSLADSNASLAQDLRDEVLRLMREGRNDDEVKTFLTERYGDFVLYRPPLKPTTAALWFAPLVFVIIGAGLVIMVVRKRRGTIVPDPDQEELDRRLEENQ